MVYLQKHTLIFSHFLSKASANKKKHTRIYKVLRICEVTLQSLSELWVKPQVQCVNEILTCWKQSGTRTSGIYEEKLSKLKLFSPVKRKPRREGTAIFQYVKASCRVEMIPLILLFVGNSTGRGTYLLKEGKRTIWLSWFSMIPQELNSTLACSVLFTTNSHSLDLVRVLLFYTGSHQYFETSMLLYSERHAS